MTTLSEVSKYLNNLETLMDAGDSLKIRTGKTEKSEEELEMFEDLEHKSVVVEVNKHKVVVFTKAPPKDYSEPFMRFSTPFIVDGQGAWDAELYLAYSDNYITKEMLGKLGFVRLNYGEYGRRMVKEACVEIHGFTFLVDFVVIDYADEGEPPVMFERDFLVTTKKKLDEVMMGRARLENKNFCDKEKDMVIEKGLPKNIYDPGNFVLPVRIGYQAFLANFLVLDIPVDKELPLSLGRPFLRTCGVIIDMGHGTMTIDS
nr:hypothetical protein [Tanacetum cinerariifolium]